MKLGLGLGHALEHAEGGVANLRIQLGLFQETTDLCPVPAVMVVVIVVMVVAGFLDQEAKTGKAAPDSLFGFEGDLFGQLQGGNGLLKEGERYAQMEEGSTEHVATDAGRTVEMEMGCRHEMRID
jgi:hypothetical protein